MRSGQGGRRGERAGRGISAPVGATARQEAEASPAGEESSPPPLPSLPLCSPRRRLAERRRVLGLRERERRRGARRGGGAGRDPRAAAAGADRLHLGAGLPAGEDLPAPEVPGGLGAEEAGGCLAALGDAGGSRGKRALPAPVGLGRLGSEGSRRPPRYRTGAAVCSWASRACGEVTGSPRGLMS